MKTQPLLFGAMFAAVFLIKPVAAADLGPGLLYKSPPPIGEDWNPWMIRARAIGVLPSTSGSSVNVVGVPALSSPSSSLAIGSRVLPEFDISYFFNRNFATEVILGVIPQRITGTGTLANLDVGRVWLLAPTAMFQYHFTDFGPLKPYIGIGATYTDFFRQSAGNVANNGIAVTSLSVNNSFGVGAQIGFDYMLDRHWGLNVDLKKFYLEPGYSAIATTGPFDFPVHGTAHMNPWLLGGGVAYKL